MNNFTHKTNKTYNKNNKTRKKYGGSDYNISQEKSSNVSNNESNNEKREQNLKLNEDINVNKIPNTSVMLNKLKINNANINKNINRIKKLENDVDTLNKKTKEIRNTQIKNSKIKQLKLEEKRKNEQQQKQENEEKEKYKLFYPDELQIILFTQIPGFEKIIFNPNMIMPDEYTDKYQHVLYFTPFIKLDPNIIKKLPKKIIKKQFFEKKYFNSLIKYHNATDLVITPSNYNKNNNYLKHNTIINNNINTLVQLLLPIGSIININNNKYTIINKKWNNDDWNIEQKIDKNIYSIDINNIRKNPIIYNNIVDNIIKKGSTQKSELENINSNILKGTQFSGVKLKQNIKDFNYDTNNNTFIDTSIEPFFSKGEQLLITDDPDKDDIDETKKGEQLLITDDPDKDDIDETKKGEQLLITDDLDKDDIDETTDDDQVLITDDPDKNEQPDEQPDNSKSDVQQKEEDKKKMVMLFNKIYETNDNFSIIADKKIIKINKNNKKYSDVIDFKNVLERMFELVKLLNEYDNSIYENMLTMYPYNNPSKQSNSLTKNYYSSFVNNTCNFYKYDGDKSVNDAKEKLLDIICYQINAHNFNIDNINSNDSKYKKMYNKILFKQDYGEEFFYGNKNIFTKETLIKHIITEEKYNNILKKNTNNFVSEIVNIIYQKLNLLIYIFERIQFVNNLDNQKYISLKIKDININTDNENIYNNETFMFLYICNNTDIDINDSINDSSIFYIISFNYGKKHSTKVNKSDNKHSGTVINEQFIIYNCDITDVTPDIYCNIPIYFYIIIFMSQNSNIDIEKSNIIYSKNILVRKNSENIISIINKIIQDKKISKLVNSVQDLFFNFKIKFDDDSGSDIGSNDDSDSGSGNDSDSDSKYDIGSNDDSDSGSKDDSGSGSGSGSDSDSDSDSDSGSGIDSDSDSKYDIGSNDDSDSGSKDDSGSGSDSDSDSDSDSGSDSEHVLKIIEQPSNGNCLYYSILYLIYDMMYDSDNDKNNTIINEEINNLKNNIFDENKEEIIDTKFTEEIKKYINNHDSLKKDGSDISDLQKRYRYLFEDFSISDPTLIYNPNDNLNENINDNKEIVNKIKKNYLDETLYWSDTYEVQKVSDTYFKNIIILRYNTDNNRYKFMSIIKTFNKNNKKSEEYILINNDDEHYNAIQLEITKGNDTIIKKVLTSDDISTIYDKKLIILEPIEYEYILNDEYIGTKQHETIKGGVNNNYNNYIMSQYNANNYNYNVSFTKYIIGINLTLEKGEVSINNNLKCKIIQKEIKSNWDTLLNKPKLPDYNLL